MRTPITGPVQALGRTHLVSQSRAWRGGGRCEVRMTKLPGIGGRLSENAPGCCCGVTVTSTQPPCLSSGLQPHAFFSAPVSPPCTCMVWTVPCDGWSATLRTVGQMNTPSPVRSWLCSQDRYSNCTSTHCVVRCPQFAHVTRKHSGNERLGGLKAARLILRAEVSGRSWVACRVLRTSGL